MIKKIVSSFIYASLITVVVFGVFTQTESHINEGQVLGFNSGFANGAASFFTIDDTLVSLVDSSWDMEVNDLNVTGIATSTEFCLTGDDCITTWPTGAGTFNIETLTGDKTIVGGTDDMYQWLDANGAARTITLQTSGSTVGDVFSIKNTNTALLTSILTIKNDTTTIDKVGIRSIKSFVFDGTNWIIKDFDEGITLGENSYTDHGISIGWNTYAEVGGTAVGRAAWAKQTGTAIGSGATGYGVSVGQGSYSNGGDGIAIGYNSNARGIAVGWQAEAGSSGVTIGSSAGDYYSTGAVSIGYEAGTLLNSGYYNTLMGYKAGDNITSGDNNIIIGDNTDSTNATDSYKLIHTN